MKRILLATLACGAIAVFAGTASADHGYLGRTNYAGPYRHGGFVGIGSQLGIGSQQYGPYGSRSNCGPYGCRSNCGAYGCTRCGTSLYGRGYRGFQQPYVGPRYNPYGTRFFPRYR